MKYNIGDRVKIIEDGFAYPDYRDWVGDFAPDYLDGYNDLRQNLGSTKGLVGTVIEKQAHSRINAKMLYLIEVDGGCVLIEEDGVELVEDEFAKTDLKTGMSVKLRDGSILLVVKGSIGAQIGGSFTRDMLIMRDRYTVISLDGYNDKLKHLQSRQYDIMEVRSLSKVTDMFEGYDYKDLEILWQRNEDILYARGFLFGSEVKSIWRLNDIKCGEDDIVEVQTFNGLQLMKVKDIIKTNNTDLDEQVGDDYIVMRKIEY